MGERKTTWLTVQQMAADLGFSVSPDKVRQWCRKGLIFGAFNKGDGKNQFWIAPRVGWRRFKRSRSLVDPKEIARHVLVRQPYVPTRLKPYVEKSGTRAHNGTLTALRAQKG